MKLRDLALGVGAAAAGVGVLLVTFSGVLASVCLWGSVLLGAGAILAAFGKALRRDRVTGIGVLVLGSGIFVAVPGMLGVVRGSILVPVGRDVELLVGIGSLICGFASVPAGIGKLKGIRRYVDWGYPLYGLGAIVAGVGCLRFSFHRGITLSAGDPGSGVLLTGLTAGLVFGVVACAAVALRIHRQLILIPPGSRVGPILMWVYPKKTFSRVFEPVLIDTRNEWLEAQIGGQYWQACWITIRGCLLLAQNLVLQLPFSVVKIIARFWKLGS